MAYIRSSKNSSVPSSPGPRPSGSSGRHPQPSSELSSLLHLHQSTQLKPACDTKGGPSVTSPAVAPAFSDMRTPYFVVGGKLGTEAPRCWCCRIMKPIRMVGHRPLLLPSRREIRIFPIAAASLFHLGFCKLIRKSHPVDPNLPPFNGRSLTLQRP